MPYRLIARSITKRKGSTMTATAMTTAEVAEALSTTPRELRKFLRADARANGKGDTLPGKGARYALPGDKRSLTAMAKKFTAWSAVQDEARKAREAAKEIEDSAVRDSVNEDDPDDTDNEPTAAELDEIDE